MAEGTVAEAPTTSTPSAPVTGQAAGASSGDSNSQNGSANGGQSASVEEQSFSNIDPKTLPPELQAVYKNLQADYTKKTQEVASDRKKAQSYDQMAKDPRFVEYWNGLNRQQKADFKEQKQVAEKRLGEKIPDDVFQKAFESKDGFLELMAKVVQEETGKSQKEIEELKQYKSINDASRIVETFATEQGPDGKPLRPDFYPLSEDGLINGYLQLNAPEKGYTTDDYQAKLDEAYSWAKGLSQKYYEKGKAEALKIIQQKAASSTMPPTNAVKGAYTGSEPKKLSVREAIDLAKRGQRVPQTYD